MSWIPSLEPHLIQPLPYVRQEALFSSGPDFMLNTGLCPVGDEYRGGMGPRSSDNTAIRMVCYFMKNCCFVLIVLFLFLRFRVWKFNSKCHL